MAGHTDLEKVIGRFPYRMAFAGGWIDQPFVSRLNPEPPGSMVVIGIEPTLRFMERSGMATGTRRVALRLWGGGIPAGRDRMDLVRELYREENRNLKDPSGSQDMIGLIYPGVNRLDYDVAHEGGLFPRHVESTCDPAIAAWIEQVTHLVPVEPRPDGYDPLGRKNLDPEWIRRLGRAGRACYDAIVARDLASLGAAMNEHMMCWDALLPDTLGHHTLRYDLKALLSVYQSRYPGAAYSGCGGGYIYVFSNEPVPGSFKIKVRLT